MSDPILTAEAVSEIFMDSLFRDGEDTADHVRAEGILRPVGFHPKRLESHRAEIVALLAELPETFHEATGGGWSFLNACVDRAGRQWGEHSNMEQLFQLGEGIGRVKAPLPRSVWLSLPGGVPYYVVTAGPTS